MSDVVAEAPKNPPKGKKGQLILGVALALLGAGGGFYAVSSGLILRAQPETMSSGSESPETLPDISFVELDPIVISLNMDREVQYLRFRAQLEVNKAFKSDVELLLPRVIDVLNSYLRALEIQDFRDPLALTKLRAQMLRRIQVVSGEGRIRDLLIMEFVLN